MNDTITSPPLISIVAVRRNCPAIASAMRLICSVLSSPAADCHRPAIDRGVFELITHWLGHRGVAMAHHSVGAKS
jgi:hypothetical protein